MATIYNRVYKVPVWVVANLTGDAATVFTDAFDAADAHILPWPASTFPLTIKHLGGRGWGHEVNVVKPYFVSLNFLHFAITKHLETTLGPNHALSGQPIQPYSILDRKITSDADYVRLFNDVMSLEPDTALSRVFDIGDRCHMEGKDQVRVFVSTGDVPTKLLQRVATRVITVGGDGADIVATGQDIKDVTDAAIQMTAATLGIN